MKYLYAIAIAALLVGSGYLLRGCLDADVSTEELVRLQVEKERALDLAESAEAAALADSAAAAEARARADTVAKENARLERDLRKQDQRVRSAETRADELAARFGETGAIEDCATALDSCTEARAEQASYIASADELAERQGEEILLRRREAEHWQGAYDSTRVALGFQREACALCEDQYRITTEIAARYRLQRDVAIVAGGVIVGVAVGVLLLR